jgi:hypothetical protein
MMIVDNSLYVSQLLVPAAPAVNKERVTSAHAAGRLCSKPDLHRVHIS